MQQSLFNLTIQTQR
uniref:Uncharacterized protein n=1 Tax=Anguilla anguilla TaxID=7936 RepID=A0A0E9XZB3_ANGAN